MGVLPFETALVYSERKQFLGTGEQESKQAVTEVVSLRKKWQFIVLRFYGPVNPMGSCCQTT